MGGLLKLTYLRFASRRSHQKLVSSLCVSSEVEVALAYTPPVPGSQSSTRPPELRSLRDLSTHTDYTELDADAYSKTDDMVMSKDQNLVKSPRRLLKAHIAEAPRFPPRRCNCWYHRIQMAFFFFSRGGSRCTDPVVTFCGWVIIHGSGNLR
jgi:hypothetical protein